MNNCTWYVQSNLNAVESEKIARACELNDKPYKLFKVIPFTTKMPKLNAYPPFVLVGSTTLNRNAFNSTKYRQGIFFNFNFTPEKYQRGFGEHFLNKDLVVYKLKDIPSDLYDLEEEIFIKCNDDSKSISGGTVYFKELLELQNNTEEHWVNGDLFSPMSEVCIAPIQEMYAEYRLIICNTVIIGSSRYRPSREHYVPKDVISFGYDMIAKWRPHNIYVMDICETDNGLKVIECNCFNGSGWYEADYGSIVHYVSDYQERR